MTKLSFLGGTGALFRRPARQEGRDAYSLLNRFDDHLLKDVGLSRRDVQLLRDRS